MKGIINKGIQQLVETKFGSEAWEKIKSLAACEDQFFAINQDYPDESTMALVKAASKVSGLPAETIMIEYGKFLIPNVLKNQYPVFFKLAGSSPREFLINMNRVHEHAIRSIAKAIPPKFEYEELSDGRLLMHYHSKRGLCVVLHGMILGVGILFNQELQVRETACVHKGEPHCIMEVTFP
ncbi:MAG: heme NO-binding domain-containing protein [candidate division Zixibacteria bacterium]|nr:heme NO-binding domain-containing protein [candidate division Zixibacteria bacterium]